MVEADPDDSVSLDTLAAPAVIRNTFLGRGRALPAGGAGAVALAALWSREEAAGKGGAATDGGLWCLREYFLFQLPRF